MSEVLTTNVNAFRHSLISQAAEDQYGLMGSGSNIEPAIDDNDVHNAFHFMVDIEIFHALDVDRAIAAAVMNCLEANALDELNAKNIKNAEAINFTMTHIRLGNAAIIDYLSEAERRHEAEYGLRPYTEEGLSAAELKWDTFLNFICPDVPEPHDFLK